MYRVTNVQGLIELMKTIQGDKSQKTFAEEIGVSPQYLSDVYNSRRDPGPSICSYLGAEPAFRVAESTITAATRSQENLNVQTKETVEKVRKQKRRNRSD